MAHPESGHTGRPLNSNALQFCPILMTASIPDSFGPESVPEHETSTLCQFSSVGRPSDHVVDQLSRVNANVPEIGTTALVATGPKRRQQQESRCLSAMSSVADEGNHPLLANHPASTTTPDSVALIRRGEQHPNLVPRGIGTELTGQLPSWPSDFGFGSPAEIKKTFDEMPMQTLEMDAQIRSPVVPLLVFDEHGHVLDLTYALLDTGNERRVIRKSRAQEQKWIEGEGIKDTLMPLVDMSNTQIKSLGTHRINGCIFGSDGPKRFKAELQVVPDDQIPPHVEDVILDIALIARSGLLNGFAPVMPVAA